MSGLYSPINRLMEQVTRPKGTGAEYMAELQKKPGYKPAEAEDRDLQALMALPQMQRAEFMEKLKEQKNKFPLKMRVHGTSPDSSDEADHEDYTLPGGENYREILLHTPMPEGQGFPGVKHHFSGMPNILASIRVKDRVSPEGKKVLHLEEIQSDWHQQGRENGYRTPEMEKEIKEVKAWKKRLQHDLRHGGYGMSAEEHEEASEALRKADDELYNMEEDLAKAVPRGPHAKDWHELALKAMIQHAAENGYDQIAVTPGAEQAKRFSLSKHIDALEWDQRTGRLYAKQKNGSDFNKMADGVTAENLHNYVGKEVSEKMMAQPSTGTNRQLNGVDLQVGGEGMKGFYDRMVPTFLNKFGKKHGVQVQQGGIDVGENPHEVVADYSDPQNMYAVRPEGSSNVVSRHFSMRDAYKAANKLNQSPLHTFDITPAMREDVLKNGIPRYADGGDVSRETKAKGGEVTMPPSMDMMQYELINRKAK